MTTAVIRADARHLPLPDASADLIVTSPPYFGLRSYTDDGAHYDGQIGSEATRAEWLAALVACTAEWVRVLKPSGSIFVNLGDKFAGSRMDGSSGWDSAPLQGGRGRLPELAQSQGALRTRTDIPAKSLLGLPWRYALACMDELGLILRRDIIWSKPNGLPESVTDRCRSSHEYLFHFTVQPRYYAAVDEIREPHHDRNRPDGPKGRDCVALNPGSRSSTDGLHHRELRNDARDYNPLGKLPGSVWEIPSQPLTVPARLGVDHFAAFPMELPRRCILGWSPPGICTECGEGRRPVVDKRYVKGQSGTSGFQRDVARPFGGGGMHGKPAMDVQATITGYVCACPQSDAPTRPALVVDPFGGTGTTALVASMHGRTGISADLSADYCRLARWRTTDPAERAKALQVPKPPPVPDGMDTLFEVTA